MSDIVRKKICFQEEDYGIFFANAYLLRLIFHFYLLIRTDKR